MTGPFFVDSNVLIYRYDSVVPEKQARASLCFALVVAWDLQDRYGLSLWDSLIVAAAQESCCRVLLTEDLQHGQDFQGVVVVNPFLEAPPELKS